jgi:hypothetical protein
MVHKSREKELTEHWDWRREEEWWELISWTIGKYFIDMNTDNE